MPAIPEHSHRETFGFDDIRERLALDEPAQAPARRRRPLGAHALLAATALSSLALLSACGSSSPSHPANLNMAQVSRSIEESFMEKRHLHATVSCPAVVVKKKGNDFTCYASVLLGTGKHARAVKTSVAVTQVNNYGRVEYISGASAP